MSNLNRPTVWSYGQTVDNSIFEFRFLSPDFWIQILTSDLSTELTWTFWTAELQPLICTPTRLFFFCHFCHLDKAFEHYLYTRNWIRKSRLLKFSRNSRAHAMIRNFTLFLQERKKFTCDFVLFSSICTTNIHTERNPIRTGPQYYIYSAIIEKINLLIRNNRTENRQ